MPATSNALNQPTRSRYEYLCERIAEGKATPAEYGEWLRSEDKPAFRSPTEGFVDPVLKGSAAVGATWLFHKSMLEKQGK